MKKIFLAIITLALAATTAEAKPKAPKPYRLNVAVEANAALNAIDPTLCTLQVGDKVRVNGKSCEVMADKKGVLHVLAEKSADGNYIAGYPSDCSSLSDHMRIVPAQLYKEGGFNKIYMPMCAEKAVDGVLTFKNLCGVLRFKVTGDAAVNCIKFEDNSGAYMTGYFNYDPEKKILVRRTSTAAGVYFTVLECSNGGNGVALTADGKEFYVVLPVGAYEKGLKVTITDRSHHLMSCDTEAFEIKADAVTEIAAIAYKPDENQLFAENFDNFVYGGNRMGGKNMKGYNPVRANASINYQYTGTERAPYLSLYNRAGSGYLQDNYRITLVENGRMHKEYLKNRNIEDWPMMFRAQEFPGYIGVGVQDNTRGQIRTPNFSQIDGIADIEVTFKFCPQAKANSAVTVDVCNAGVIKEYWINGERRSLTRDNYPYIGSNIERLRLSNSAIRLPGNDSEWKPWYEVKLIVSGATAQTNLFWQSEFSSSEYINGFFLDDIEVKLISSVPRERILRIMDYNVQNGIWSDQANNYNGFVEWMKQEDVDIAIFCEACTIYYDGTGKGSKAEERYLPYKYKPYEFKKDPNMEPEGWIELAARFGHKYVKIGAHQDNYPVVVTSKYPIVFTQKLGGKDVSHGGIHAQVEVDGKRINIVGFHTWPQAFYKGFRRNTPAAIQSEREHGGNKMRLEEFQIFMERTILNPEFANEEHWIITGDMNCPSPLDDAHHKFGPDNPRYWGQKYMLENVTKVKDLIKVYNCPDKRDVIIPSTQGWGRIDLMYGSDLFVKTMIKAKSPRIGWTRGQWDKETGFFKNCGSDHLPVTVDFVWR